MLQEITTALSEFNETAKLNESKTRGQYTEELLTNICNLLGEVGSITNNNADVEFIIGVVASYLITKERGNLAEDVKPPSVLFDEVLFPQIDTMEIRKERIEDGDDIIVGEIEGDVPKQITSNSDK